MIFFVAHRYVKHKIEHRCHTLILTFSQMFALSGLWELGIPLAAYSDIISGQANYLILLHVVKCDLVNYLIEYVDSHHTEISQLHRWKMLWLWQRYPSCHMFANTDIALCFTPQRKPKEGYRCKDGKCCGYGSAILPTICLQTQS